MCWRTYTVFILSRESCGRQSQKQVHKSGEGCRGRKKKKKGFLVSSLFSNNDARMKGEWRETHLVRGYGANSEQGKAEKKSFELLQCKGEIPQEYASALISLFKPVCASHILLYLTCCLSTHPQKYVTMAPVTEHSLHLLLWKVFEGRKNSLLCWI